MKAPIGQRRFSHTGGFPCKGHGGAPVKTPVGKHRTPVSKEIQAPRSEIKPRLQLFI